MSGTKNVEIEKLLKHTHLRAADTISERARVGKVSSMTCRDIIRRPLRRRSTARCVSPPSLAKGVVERSARKAGQGETREVVAALLRISTVPRY